MDIPPTINGVWYFFHRSGSEAMMCAVPLMVAAIGIAAAEGWRLRHPIRRGLSYVDRAGQLLAPTAVTALVPWRPLFGGDEDRNSAAVEPAAQKVGWRPLFGGDEDSN